MTTDPDPILAALAALGGSIPAARDFLAVEHAGIARAERNGWLVKIEPRYARALYDLALRALDAMERPAGGDEKLREVLDNLWRLDLVPADAGEWPSDAAIHRDEAIRDFRKLIDRMLSEPAPASDAPVADAKVEDNYKSLDHAMEILRSCVSPYTGEQAQKVAKALKQWQEKWKAAVDHIFPDERQTLADLRAENARLKTEITRLSGRTGFCAECERLAGDFSDQDYYSGYERCRPSPP